jgi:hypothetical protein
MGIRFIPSKNRSLMTWINRSILQTLATDQVRGVNSVKNPGTLMPFQYVVGKISFTINQFINDCKISLLENFTHDGSVIFA